MKYLDESRGLNGSTPSEALHFILQGYFVYALSQFAKLRNLGSQKGNYVFGASSDFLKWTNTRCKIIGFHLSRQGDKNLPRTHFPTGYIITNKKKKEDNSGKKTGQELVGVVLVLLMFLNSDEPLQYLSKKMKDSQIASWIQVFEFLIPVYKWTQSE